METVLIQINNEKAYKLLEDLEALDIIKVLKSSENANYKLSDKYQGKLSSVVAEELQEYVTKSRITSPISCLKILSIPFLIISSI
jgi:arginine repressor